MLAQTKTGKLPHNLHLENARVSYFLRALRRLELAGLWGARGEGPGKGKGRITAVLPFFFCLSIFFTLSPNLESYF